MLAIDGLEVAYGPVRALRGVTLEVAEGEIVSVVGPNGAGKSTLLLAIAGALDPSAGEVRFGGERISGRAAETIARLGISADSQLRLILHRHDQVAVRIRITTACDVSRRIRG